MKYTLTKLRDDVMVRLGETARPTSSSNAYGVPTAADVVMERVKGLLPGVGARLIIEAAEIPKGDGESLAGAVTMHKMPSGLYAAEIALPGEFLRFDSCKMAEWLRASTVAVLPGGREWLRQWSKEPGIAGSKENPRAYVDVGKSGLLLRMMGSSGTTDTLEYCRIYCVPQPGTDGSFFFPASLYPRLLEELTID